jgi:hypothetical protein
MRLQVGHAQLDDGTAFVVAEGTRSNPLPEGGPDSTFLLSTTDSGLSWTFRRAFDRESSMPIDTFHTKPYPLGPSEPNIAVLPDGKTMVMPPPPFKEYCAPPPVARRPLPFADRMTHTHDQVIVARMMNGAHLWQASSKDRGATWTRMAETAAWAVYPQVRARSDAAAPLRATAARHRMRALFPGH